MKHHFKRLIVIKYVLKELEKVKLKNKIAQILLHIYTYILIQLNKNSHIIYMKIK